MILYIKNIGICMKIILLKKFKLLEVKNDYFNYRRISHREDSIGSKNIRKISIPYLLIDYLKMGSIRSGKTNLTPEDDRKLESYMWPIIKEMMKTAIENKQNLVIEGGYIPFTWKADFNEQYLKEIRYSCLVMSKKIY